MENFTNMGVLSSRIITDNSTCGLRHHHFPFPNSLKFFFYTSVYNLHQYTYKLLTSITSRGRIVVKVGLFVFDCGGKGRLKIIWLNLADYHNQPYPKIDNNKLSSTFETLLKIISCLIIDISDLRYFRFIDFHRK